MPGFGDDPFGEPLFGLGSVAIPPRRLLQPIAAKKWDPTTRTFPVNDAGQYIASEPLDQWVRLQMSIALGGIPSDPGSGNPALRHKYINRDHVKRVRDELAQLLSAREVTGELQVHTIEVQTAGNATLMGVEYSNLLTGERRPRATFNSGA